MNRVPRLGNQLIGKPFYQPRATDVPDLYQMVASLRWVGCPSATANRGGRGLHFRQMKQLPHSYIAGNVDCMIRITCTYSV